VTTNNANQTSPANQISLLAYLAYKFGGQTETIATEALGYILSRSEAARNALRDMIGIGGVDVGRIARVQTEVPIEVDGKEARVDLVGFDDGNAKRALIEVKFWAGLTENQPNTYLKELLKNATAKPSVLLFVAPESRMATLWAELRRLANAGGFALSYVPSATNPMSMAIKGGPHCLMLRSWRTMLGSMASRASVDGDSSAERSILELNGLCEQEDSDAFLPLRTNELGPQVARRIQQFIHLPDGAWQDKRVLHYVNPPFGPIASSTIRHGRFLTLVDDVPVWFGVSYDLWAKQGDTPLWLIVRNSTAQGPVANFTETKRCLAPLLVENPGSVIDDPAEGLLIPFFLPTGVEKEEVLESVAAYLAKIAELLIRAPQPAPASTP